jgi:hypothetical protein
MGCASKALIEEHEERMHFPGKYPRMSSCPVCLQLIQCVCMYNARSIISRSEWLCLEIPSTPERLKCVHVMFHVCSISCVLKSDSAAFHSASCSACCATQGHVWQVDGALQLFHPDVELIKARKRNRSKVTPV